MGRRAYATPSRQKVHSMSIAPSKPDAPKSLSEVVKAKREQIAEDNEAEKPVRDARRRALRRASPEYQIERAEARETYAAKIAAEQGRAVRPYSKVPGKTRAEHDENAKKRDAARKREERSLASQKDKDDEADRKWKARKRKIGWSEAKIAEGLEKRVRDRKAARPYDDNPGFGRF